MQRIKEYPQMNWEAAISPDSKEQLLHALESSQVIYFPDLTIPIKESDWSHLSDTVLLPGVKNVSYDKHTDTVKGVHPHLASDPILSNFIKQFAEQAIAFVRKLLPHYGDNLQIGRTSYRPAEIFNRPAPSKHKDDTLLHVDAFPATPTASKRILRLFVNINPEGKKRLWRLGEPLEAVLKYFVPQLKPPIPMSRKFMQLCGITRGYRTLYDHYMLHLHDTMKMDGIYQQKADQIQFGFPTQSTWMVFTDSVSHAALSGQYLLEQTFYLPVEAMRYPHFSPFTLLSQFFPANRMLV